MAGLICVSSSLVSEKICSSRHLCACCAFMPQGQHLQENLVLDRFEG